VSNSKTNPQKDFKLSEDSDVVFGIGRWFALSPEPKQPVAPLKKTFLGTGERYQWRGVILWAINPQGRVACNTESHPRDRSRPIQRMLQNADAFSRQRGLDLRIFDSV
jgi:hypothetical protein